MGDYNNAHDRDRDRDPCASVEELKEKLASRDRDLERLKMLIRQTQKLEGLGILAGGIAHDFNNLLVGILGHCSLMLSDLPEVSALRPQLVEIEQAAQRAADLASQLLAYSGRGQREMKPVDLNKLLREMIKLLEVSISKKAILAFDLKEDLPAIEGDSAQLSQVVMNLITNASEALGDRSGAISLGTGVLKADHTYLAQARGRGELPAGEYVYLRVSDTGYGMDRHTREHLFDAFYTTKEGGHGLGLSAVLGIVDSHQGAIKVRSKPQQGTTFEVLFPASPAKSREVSKDSQPAATWDGEGAILVIDDEQTVRRVIRTALERSGFEVLLAEDGLQGVEVYEENADRISVVVLDMTMPFLNGRETYHELRRIRDDVRVLVISGYSEQEIHSQFEGQSLSGFLHKPFRTPEFLGVVRQIVDA